MTETLLRDLPARDIRRLLCEGKLSLRMGPFWVRVRSDVAGVSEGVIRLYANHVADPMRPFADFHAGVHRVRRWRRGLRNEIRFTVDGDEGLVPMPGDHALPALEWGLNWCIGQQAHRFLVLHAAVLEKAGRALVMPGVSGAGKSTLTAALAHRGWRLLSDELALLDPVDMRLWPLARPISLKNASIDLIKAFVPEAVFSETTADTTKGHVAFCAPPRQAVEQSLTPAMPGWIVMPRWRDNADPELAPIPQGEMVMHLIEACFNYSLHRTRGFMALGSLVGRSGCFSFTYSRLDDGVRNLDALASEEIGP